MNAVIRPCTREDLDAVVRLLSQLSLDTPRESLGPPLPPAYERALATILSDQRQTLLVAVDENHIVGSIAFILVPNLSYGGRPHAILENVVVDSTSRSQGIGEATI